MRPELRPLLHALCLTPLLGLPAIAAAPPAPTPTDAELQALVGDSRAAAEKGDANAQYDLAVKLQYGEPQDLAAAIGWYRKAAAQGHVEAIESIGHCYYTGSGVKQDLAEAARWWRQAADKGSATAQYWMGDFYDGGRGGLKEDPAEAVRWFRKAADQGDASSEYRLGDMYVQGRGVPRSDAEGVKWLQMSAKKDDPNAQYSLGEMYRDGRGVTKDDQHAYDLFRAAADQDSELAMVELGRGYEQGRGMKAPDPVCAMFWYGFAATRNRSWGGDEHDALAAKATPAQRADADRMIAATHFDAGQLQRPLCSDETMEFDIRGTELQDVLPVFRQLSALPIVGLEGVSRTVKLQSEGATWQQALTLLLDGIGYRWERKGDVIQVTKKAK
jgi:TPR repeat protein